MISEKTLLVLGAASSMYYSFPLGKDLLEMMRQLISRKGITKLQEDLLNELSFSEEYSEYFLDCLRFSSQLSIDELFARNQYIRQLGKHLVTYCIMQSEFSENLERLSFSDAEPTKWYGSLFRQLHQDCNSLSDFSKNQLTIITFNYDRSLEHALMNDLVYTYGATPPNDPHDLDPDLIEAYRSIKIIHVYGQIGFPTWDGRKPGRPYKSNCTKGDILDAARGIQFYSEPMVSKSNEQAIAEAMSNTETVGFLGFAYNQANLDRLFISEIKFNTFVFGTSIGLPNESLKRVSQYFRQARQTTARQRIGDDFPIKFVDQELHTIMDQHSLNNIRSAVFS